MKLGFRSLAVYLPKAVIRSDFHFLKTTEISNQHLKHLRNIFGKHDNSGSSLVRKNVLNTDFTRSL